jgi:hypothetical protein
MGWWKVQGTQDTVGDLPLDVLGASVSRVVSLYQDAHERRPTKEEWEALPTAVLGAEEPDARVLDVGTVHRVRLE